MLNSLLVKLVHVVKCSGLRPEPKWKGLYNVGGVSLLLAGALLIIGFALAVTIPRVDLTQQALTMMAGASIMHRLVDGIFILVIILFVPGMLALYSALRNEKRTHMVIATSLFAIAAALFLASMVLAYALIRLSESYVTAAGTERAAYLAAWQLGRAASLTGLILAQSVASVAVIIVAAVLLKGAFGRGAAYLSIVAGVVGLIGSVPVPWLFLVYATSNVLFAIWFLVVGYNLYKLG